MSDVLLPVSGAMTGCCMGEPLHPPFRSWADRPKEGPKKVFDPIVNYKVYTEDMSILRNTVPAAKYLKIGEVAKRSGVGVESLRFYESRGLIEPAGRTPSGYRMYDSSVFERLSFIKKAQAVGFTLDEIAWVIQESKQGRRPCAEVREMAEARLTELDEKLAELKRYRQELKKTIDAWNERGEADGMVCGLIESLQPESLHSPSPRGVAERVRGRRRRRA